MRERVLDDTWVDGQYTTLGASAVRYSTVGSPGIGDNVGSVGSSAVRGTYHTGIGHRTRRLVWYVRDHHTASLIRNQEAACSKRLVRGARKGTQHSVVAES